MKTMNARFPSGALIRAVTCPLLFFLATAANAQKVPDPLEAYAARVDAAVDAGLDYLASVQKEDGSFPGGVGRTAGVVGLCGMAFLSKGYTPAEGRHSDTINRCIDYCLSIREEKSGYMGAFDGKMYSHNIATLFLLESSGMTDKKRQEKLDKAIAEAIKLIVSAQQVNKDGSFRGGWRYYPTSADSDLSCSGWAIMALRSARLNGVSVPDKAVKDAADYLDRRFDPHRGTFGYQDTAGYNVTLTGAGLLCLELTGHHGEPKTFKAGDHLLSGFYYTSQAMFQLGGKYWERFAPWMYDFWLPKQARDGSWRGGGGQWGPDDKPYYTALSILAFTVPYRQLPIYQRDETVDEEK
jgi:hypothetical protein